MEKKELTTIEKAQAEYQTACEAYEKKTHTPTANMNPAQKKNHLEACMKLLDEKHRLRREIEALRSNKGI